MPDYRVYFEYDIREGSEVDLTANNPEDAKESALAEIKEIYQDIQNIKVLEVEELNG